MGPSRCGTDVNAWRHWNDAAAKLRGAFTNSHHCVALRIVAPRFASLLQAMALPRHNGVTQFAEHDCAIGAPPQFFIASQRMNDVSATFRAEEALPRPASRSWRPERCERVALVLQGGGA